MRAERFPLAKYPRARAGLYYLYDAKRDFLEREIFAGCTERTITMRDYRERETELIIGQRHRGLYNARERIVAFAIATLPRGDKNRLYGY